MLQHKMIDLQCILTSFTDFGCYGTFLRISLRRHIFLDATGHIVNFASQPTHTVDFWLRHCPAHSAHSYTPGRSRRVITQARGMSVSRLHCTLGFDDRALLLLVGTQTSEFFAAKAHMTYM